jgi:hypothetical protein
MPLATASVILQNYTLDLMLLGTSASGASNRFVAKDILTVQSNAAIYDKDIVLRTSSTSGTYLRAGLGISFDESGYKNQVVIAQDVTIASNVNTNVKVEPLLKPLSSGVTGTVLAPIRLQLTSVDTTNNIDSWYFIDLMPKIQGNSPFTQAKIKTTNLPADSPSVMVKESKLAFGNTVLTIANTDVIKTPINLFNTFVRVHIASVDSTNFVDSWRYIDFMPTIQGESPFTQSKLRVSNLDRNTQSVVAPYSSLVFENINVSLTVSPEIFISFLDTINDGNSLFTQAVIEMRKLPFDYSSITVPDSTFVFNNVPLATEVSIRPQITWVDEGVDVYIHSINTNNNIDTWRYIDFISNIDNGISPFTQVNLGVNRLPSNAPFVQIPDSVLIFNGISTSKSVPPELYVSSVDTNNNGNILYTKVVVKTRKIPFDFSSITIPDSAFTFGNVQPTANVNAEARLSWVDEGVDVYIDSINTSNINTWRYIDFVSDIDNGTSPFTQASIKVSRLPSNAPFVQIPDSVLTFDGISTSKSVPPELYVSFVGTNNFIDTWRFIDSMPTIQGSSPFTQVILKTRKIPFDTSSIAIPDSAFTFAGIQPSTDVSSIKNIFLSGGDTATVYYAGSPDTSLISVGLFNTFTAFVPTSPGYNGVIINQNSASIVYFDGAPNQVSVAVGSLFSYVTNFIDTWRFIDLMPTVESISPFTQAKITVTETPVEYNFVTILQSSLVFNNISAIESSVVVNRNSEAIIYFNGNPRTLPISIGLSSNPFPVSVPSLNDVRNTLLSGNDTATIYFNGIPGTLPISVGLFNTFTAFVPTSPGYNGVIVNQNSTSIAYFDGAPGTVPISVGLFNSYVTNFIDTWRFIDSMPTVESISPFTQSKIKVTKTPVEYASVTVPQSSLTFNGLTALESSAIVNRNSEAIIYFNGSPRTLPISAGLTSSSFRVTVPPLSEIKNTVLSGNNIKRTVYFDGLPGTLPISTGLFNTFTAFVPPTPGYNGVFIARNSRTTVYFDGEPNTLPISTESSNTYVTGIFPFSAAQEMDLDEQEIQFYGTDPGITEIYFNGSPNTLPISAGSQTNYLTGPIPLCGIQAMDLSNQDTQIDTTTFQSGVKTDASVVRSARSYNVSGIALVGDEALEKIVKKANGLTPTSFEFVGDEVYAVATFPDGEKIEGAALITNLSLPGNQNEVKKYSFTLTFLGKKMSQILL